MNRRIKLAILFYLFWHLGFTMAQAGGGHPHDNDSETAGISLKAQESVQKTAWTDKSELFMEFNSPVANEPVNFLMHLTDLNTFKPLTEGPLLVSLIPENGSPIHGKVLMPDSPGIFKISLIPLVPGRYQFLLDSQSPALTDTLRVANLMVSGKKTTTIEEHDEHTSVDSASHSGGEGLLFLKEQQWAIKFKAFPPEVRKISSRLMLTGELIGISTSENVVSALRPLQKAMQRMKPGVSGNYFTIKAPIGGMVTERNVANGEFVQTGHSIIRIIDTSSLWLRANVPVSETFNIPSLQRANFTVSGLDRVFRPTNLVSVSDVVDSKTRTVPVLFEVANYAHLLKIGMFVNVMIKTGDEREGLSVPETALFEEEGKNFLYVQVSGETFVQREVEVGPGDAGWVLINKGLAADDRVVVEGGYYIKQSSRKAELRRILSFENGFWQSRGSLRSFPWAGIPNNTESKRILKNCFPTRFLSRKWSMRPEK